MSNKINIFAEDILLPFQGITKAYVKKRALSASQHLEISDLNCLIILTSDAYIREINRKFRKKNRPTDVISFPGSDLDLPGIPSLPEPGEIYISLETGAAQALKTGIPLKEEVDRLIVHGILHIRGYDHERSAEDEAEMAALEDKILKKLQSPEN